MKSSYLVLALAMAPAMAFAAPFPDTTAPSVARSTTAQTRARPGSITGVMVAATAAGAKISTLHDDTTVYPAAPDDDTNPPDDGDHNGGHNGDHDHNGGHDGGNHDKDHNHDHDHDNDKPTLPTEPIISTLGVTASTARAACNSIVVDGHAAQFNESTYECDVPVVAHNWGGVISKDGDDVVAYAPMDSIFTCKANSFDNIDNLRRSSQWVVPVMVAGGAGVGAGIGAISDAHKKKAEQAAFEAGRAGLTDGTLSTGDITSDVTIQGMDQAKIQELIAAAENNIKECAAEAFTEMVSPNFQTNVCKLGRIKITSGTDCDGNSDNSDRHTSISGFPYCSYNYVHTTNAAGKALDSVMANCNGTEDAYVQCPDTQFGVIAAGTCYYRDGVTGTNAGQTNAYQNGRSNIFGVNEDSEPSYDLHRCEMFKTLAAAINSSDPATAAQFKGITQAANDITCDEGAMSPEVEANNNLNPGSTNAIKITTSKPFSQVLSEIGAGGDVSGACARASMGIFADEPLSAGAANNTIERMNQAIGYLQGLNGAQNLVARLQVITNATTQIQATYQSYDDWVASDPAQKKTFFQKGVGKGLLIGAGIGAAGGLAYWFAEGGSTYCNVAGMQDVKLNKSYSIPSFQNYIMTHGFVK